MQTATSETESKSLDLSICVHHYTLRAPCPKGQGIISPQGSFGPDQYSIIEIARPTAGPIGTGGVDVTAPHPPRVNNLVAGMTVALPLS